jgi:sigma-B regulation protein RsbU (phosphoserine phosphatase)
MMDASTRATDGRLHFVPIADNPRIPVFLHMLRNTSGARNATEILSNYMEDLTHLYEDVDDFIHIVTRGLRPGRFRVFRDLDTSKHGPDYEANLEEIENTLPVLKGGLFGELISTPEPKLVHHLSVPFEPVTGTDLSRFGSLCAFPLFHDGDIGGWIVMFKSGPTDAQIGELEEIMVHGNLVTTAAAGIRVAQRLREVTAHIDREVEHIAAIQRALLPAQMPDIAGTKIDAAYETFDRAGGDYYDFIPLDPDPETGQPKLWVIVIADASGHGPAAAVVIAMLHALLHSFTGVPEGPAQFLEYLNVNLQSHRIGGAFITAWIGFYCPETRELRYASAGHEVPILMDMTHNPGILTRLEQPNGFPLGIWDHVGSQEAIVRLRRGQTLVLYTDGITEARSPEREQFRVEGIENALRACNGEPDCVTLNVIDSLRDHEAGQRPQDDQTLVAIKIV